MQRIRELSTKQVPCAARHIFAQSREFGILFWFRGLSRMREAEFASFFLWRKRHVPSSRSFDPRNKVSSRDNFIANVYNGAALSTVNFPPQLLKLPERIASLFVYICKLSLRFKGNSSHYRHTECTVCHENSLHLLGARTPPRKIPLNFI